MLLYSPIAPVNLGDHLHLQIVRLVLGKGGAQQLPPAFQQRQHHLPQRGEFVFLPFLVGRGEKFVVALEC